MFRNSKPLKLSEAARILEDGGSVCSVTEKQSIKMVETLTQLCGRAANCHFFEITEMNNNFQQMFMDGSIPAETKIAKILATFGTER